MLKQPCTANAAPMRRIPSLQAGPRKSRSVPRNPRGSQYERDGSLKIVGGFHATVRGFVRRFRDHADHFARVHVLIPQETFGAVIPVQMTAPLPPRRKPGVL